MKYGNINTEKNSNLSVERARSKTARKFKSYFGHDALPHCISVVLDWFACMVFCNWPAPEKANEITFVDDDIAIEYTGKGTPVFNYSFKVYLWGEPVAMFHSHSKNETIIPVGVAKLEILNHVLYSGDLLETLSRVMQACKMPEIKNISRVDIAIDGANHVHKFLNRYVDIVKRQGVARLQSLGAYNPTPTIHLKGKARFHAKMLNKHTGMFDNFHIGGSKKKFTLYNKTSELERSHKEYIRSVWEKAGIDTSTDVWRCELRLTSEAIKEIKDFNINNLQNPMYLLSIFKTQCENFVHFVDMEGQTNVTYATTIDLFQFEKLAVPMLHKMPRAVVDGAYKAKMAIHNAVKQVIQIRDDVSKSAKEMLNVQAALQHVSDNIKIYNLERWFRRKIDQWNERYSYPNFGTPIPVSAFIGT